MMRSAVGRTKTNYLPPTVIDGIPVKKGWKDAGGKPNKKSFVMIHYDEFKYVKCPSGYVLLCADVSCKNLAISDNFKCPTHNRGEELYTFCRDNNCIKNPVFGYENKKPLYCKDHKKSDMTDVENIQCELCKKQPNFGYDGQRATRCKEHILIGMIDVINRRCEKCPTQPTFGYEGQKAVRCKAHILVGMIDVCKKCCEVCDTIPIFGFNGERPRRCKMHIIEGMIDIISRRCEQCDTIPTFGFEGGKALRCKTHILEKMVDVRNKRCEECDTIPTFGYQGEKALRCKTHFLEGMVNVIDRRCEQCYKIPTFGFEGEKIRRCKTHAIEGMVDIVNKKCGDINCTKYPSYGKLYSSKRMFCVEHSSLNHYYCENFKPICQTFNCKDFAYFIDPDDPTIYPIHCRTHQNTNVELINKICLNCNEKVYFPSNKKICMNCGKYRIEKIHKFQETMIKNFLTSNKISFIHDRPISKNGSLRRPDFLIDSRFGVIIVEVDEHQHKREGYNYEDEINRMRIIYYDVQIVKPCSQVLFIRYNPDQYDGKDYSCKERQEYLYVIIMHCINVANINTPLGQIKLFYDGFIGNCEIQSLC